HRASSQIYLFLSPDDHRQCQIRETEADWNTIDAASRTNVQLFARTKRTGQMIKVPMPLLGAILLLPIVSDATHAGRTTPPTGTPLMRTYVSGLGSDSNPCTAASPCATFQAALAMTLAGG